MDNQLDHRSAAPWLARCPQRHLKRNNPRGDRRENPRLEERAIGQAHEQESRYVREQKARRHHAKTEARGIVIILDGKGRHRAAHKERYAKKLDEVKKVKQANYFAEATCGSTRVSRRLRISVLPWLSNVPSRRTPFADARGP